MSSMSQTKYGWEYCVAQEMMLYNIYVNSEYILNDKIPDDPQPSISILLRSKYFNRRLADPGIPLMKFLSFSCSFQQKSCKIIGFRPKLRSWRPRLEILDPPLWDKKAALKFRC